jgi:Putative transposase, YhgA-like
MDERHDRSFRLLFSHPRMVRDLLCGFPPEPWIEWLDLATLERIDLGKTGTSPDRLGELLIWRVLWEGGSNWVYLLLRPQREVDPFMGLSLATCQTLLYLELARRHDLAPEGKPLPPVLPLVLHTGDEPWAAPLHAFDLFMPLPASLHLYVPRGRYSVIDLPHTSVQTGAGNLVGLLAELERSRTPEAIGLGIERLLALTRGPEQVELRRAWTEFLRDSLMPRRLPGVAAGRAETLEDLLLALEARRVAWNG